MPNNRPSDNVIDHLIEIFKAVADCHDGADDTIIEAYEEAMEYEEFRDFYGDLIDQRSREVFGEEE